MQSFPKTSGRRGLNSLRTKSQRLSSQPTIAFSSPASMTSSSKSSTQVIRPITTAPSSVSASNAIQRVSVAKRANFKTSSLSTIGNIHNMDATVAKTQFQNSVRLLHTSLINGVTSDTTRVSAQLFASAMKYHTSVAETPLSTTTLKSDANPLHTIFSADAQKLKVPSISSLAKAMQDLSDSVASGAFFALTVEQQLALFHPLSQNHLARLAGINMDNAEMMELFEVVFKENYRLAAQSRDIDVVANIHKAVMEFSAYKEFVDKIEVNKEKKEKDSEKKKEENENDKEKEDKDNKEEKEDKDAEKKEEKQEKEDKDVEKKEEKDDNVEEKYEGKEQEDKDVKQDKETAQKPRLRKLSEEQLSKMWDNVMEEVDKNSEKQMKANKAKMEREQSKAKGPNKNEDRDQNELDKFEVNPVLRKVMIFFSVFIVLAIVTSILERSQRMNNSYQTFVDKYLANGLVKYIDVRGTTAIAIMKPQVVGGPIAEGKYVFDFVSYEMFEKRLREDINRLGVADVPLVVSHNNESMLSLLANLIPTALIIGGSFFLFQQMKKGGGPLGRDPFSAGKKFTVVKDVKTRFSDVAGLDEAKKEIMEFIDFLKQPERYQKLGAKLPKGALLSGPPGTGKTLLAKAAAGEAGVAFYSVSGSEFLEMFVGVGASRMRELFKAARKNAPSIVFIDEIDAVARSRSQKGGMGGNDEREATLNQMLVEMDGFNSNEAVVVFAGTNRPDMLDKALLRAGRFDRKIPIDAPDIAGRSAIFKVHLAGIVTSVDKDDIAAKLSALTPGMVGADIANVCNEAAIIAARKHKDTVEMVDFEQAVDRIIGGLEKHQRIMSAEERKTVAYHEAGHAVIGWVLEHAEPLLKVTIVPRSSGALGFAQYLPRETALYSTEALCDMICMALGGRAAEETFFSRITTGASDDIKRTTNIARSMVARYGMSSPLYNMCYDQESQERFYAPYAEATSAKIDHETQLIVEAQYKRCLDLINANRDKIEALAQALLEKETINHDGLVAILGERTVKSDAYLKYLEAQRTAVAELNEEQRKKQEEEVKKVREEKAALEEKERKANAKSDK